MGLLARGIFWFGAYLALVLGPLGAAALATPSGRSFQDELGTAAGFVAFALLAVELALVARLRPVSTPFGTDVLMLVHRQMGLVALAFTALHALLAAGPSAPSALLFASPSRGVDLGAAALWAALVLVVSSVLRRRLRLPYEAWRFVHVALAVAIVGLALLHARELPRYGRDPRVAGVLALWAAAFLALLARYRLLRPLALWRRPWEVLANRDEGASVRTLVLRPVAGRAWPFEPGQFVWVNTGRTPFAAAEHPISISSSAEVGPDGTLELSIKALGAWSRDVVPRLEVGRRVWVDGPFGAFTPDRTPAQGFVLIAGGIGISPMRSILLTLRDRGDPRPVLLVYAAHDASRAAFLAELGALQAARPLALVTVFEQRAPGEEGERGFVTADLLRRHLPADAAHRVFFVCGPAPMMDAVEEALSELGVPPERVSTERFDMV